MKKKIFCSLLITVFMLVGMGVVNAAQPTLTQMTGFETANVRPVITVNTANIVEDGPFQIGQEITVRLNATETREFFVIEAGATTVTAILKGFLGGPVTWFQPGSGLVQPNYNFSYVKGVVDARTATWTNASNIGLITIEQIRTLLNDQNIGTSNTTIVNRTFSANSPLNAPGNYWTATYATFQPNAAPSDCHVYVIRGTGNPPTTPGGSTPGGGGSTPGSSTENPPTGLNSPYFFGGIALIGIFTAIVIFRKRNYFEKL